jgi:hypothetical protein
LQGVSSHGPNLLGQGRDRAVPLLAQLEGGPVIIVAFRRTATQALTDVTATYIYALADPGEKCKPSNARELRGYGR